MSTQVFPSLPGLTYSVTRTIEWNTQIQEAISGKETRLGYWSAARYTWTMSFSFLRSNTFSEFQTLWGFLSARKGRFDSFLYSDVEDFSSTGQLLGVGDSTTRNFQLLRQFGGSSAAIEPSLAPNVVSQILVNGSSISSTSFTVGPWQSTAPGPGVVAFSTFAPTAGQSVAANYSWYFPCRLDDDVGSFDNFMNKLWENKKLIFRSIK